MRGQSSRILMSAPQAAPQSVVVAIFGPTASGKTAVAERVAERLGGEVVSADSMQAYRGLPILTAQPVRPTRLVGIWPLSHEGSVAEYAGLAHAAIDELLAADRTPVLAGGTGLYLRAALAELDVPPAPSAEQRSHWERVYDRLGAERAHAELAARDAEAAERLHPNDRRRVVRALELTALGSRLPSAERLWTEETRHPTIVFGLDLSREALAERIEARVRAMFAAGEGGGRCCACRRSLVDRRTRARTPRDLSASARRGAARVDRPNSTLRCVSAEVDATHSEPC